MNGTTKRNGQRGEALRGILGSVRRRWRARLLLKGASLVLAAGLAAFLGSAFGVEWFRFSPTAVTAFRWVAWGTVIVLSLWFLVRPLLRRVSDEQVALYLEEHEPTLEAAILGAVAAREAAQGDPARAATPAMLDRLVERAISRAGAVDDGRGIEKQALFRHGGIFAGLTVAALALLLFGPTSLRTGVSALMPNRAADEVSPYSITVDPGDLTVARGSDQFVTALLHGFTTDEVSLFTRGGENDPFQRLSMIPASSSDEGAVPFESMLLNLQSDTDYFVESDGIRSETFRITVADLPYVDRMQHEYRYPTYTGLEPRIVEDAGDIAALRGTSVALSIQPTIPTTAGRVLIGDDVVELEAGPDGTLAAVLDLTEEGFYQIELAMGDGTLVEASPRYTIDLLTDAAPMVRFETPGRDSPASPIEEVYLEIQADDDYGVREVLLAYSVNGQPEDTVSVYHDAGPPLPELTVGHTLYLEDYEVEPGDVISYYAVARDQQGSSVEARSDIYFLTIQPFRREFREAEQQGGPPQGGGEGQQANEERLSELQRQVIAATFNLDRDRDRYEETEFEESSTAVALAQGRVREQVSTLVERMTNRGLTEAEDDFRAIAEMLPGALAAMDTAEVMLRDQDVRGALAPEQRALRVLQKAEESYEVYVSEQQPGGGGGGGGGQQANAEDLADLFELELDKLRNQYETVQRGERQAQADQTDELMQKLNELARRQQQEAERQRARASQGQQSGGGGGAQSQRELADETEEAARQLERLARETNDRQLQETASQLQQAADAMRRAASQGGNAGAAESARAQEQLADAQRRLERSRESRVGEDAQEAMDRVERLQQQQRDLTEQVDGLPEDPTQRGEQVRRIQERKTEMAREVGELERDLDRLAADARQEDPQAARELGEAAEAIRSSRLNQKILWSRGVVEQREREFARIFEEGLEEDFESLRQQVAEASAAADRIAEEEGMSEALDQARDLVRGVESLNRRLDSSRQQPDSLGEDGQQGEEGQQGGQQGQEGQQGGQQGQEGQQGGQQGQQGGQQGQQGGQQGQQGGQQGGQANAEGQQGQQGGQGGRQAGQSNPDGSPASQSSMRGGATRGNPTRDFTEEEIRQFAREFEQRYRDARELRDVLSEQGQSVEDLDRALEALQGLRDAENYQDLPQIEALRNILRENLGRVEFSLRRIVEGDAAGRAAIRGSDDVPPGFEQLVEEYYRNLARSGAGGGGG